MTDVYVGLGVMAVLAAGLFVLGQWLGKKLSRRWAVVVGLVPAAAIAAHLVVLLDNPRWAWVLPVPNLVVVGDISPLAVAFLAGLAWRHIPPPVVRKLTYIVPLCVISILVSYWRLLGQPPTCQNAVVEGATLQSSPATAAPAAAASFLSLNGIETTEGEMARRCLTRSWGTTRLGLWRGLKLRTADAPQDVQLVSWTLDELRQKPSGPVLLLLDKELDQTGDPRGWSRWGLARTLPAVGVFLGFETDEVVDVVDPNAGREQWNIRHLRLAWQGLAYRLVPDEPAE
ncbi:MAG: hypothetical protein ACODAJ_04030 [Planctomycetota bacterium]